MSEWYYADARRERHGPVDADLIRNKFRQGELDLATLVWREGMSQWQPLSSVSDELQLVTEANAGIDLRADYTAIENGTAPLPGAAAAAAAAGSDGGGYSPYTAPSASTSESNAPVRGGEIIYAGFWRRVAAYFIDYVILLAANYAVMIPMSILMVVVGGASGGSNSDAGSVFAMLIMGIGYLFVLGINIMYPAWMHSSRNQATLGKMAVGIKVVRLSGEQISLSRGVGRAFATILSSLILCMGYLMAAFTERKQSLHDMICDTLVVDKWAFTDHPERQQRGLGTVTIVVLAIMGLILLVGVVAFIALIGVAAANFN